MVSAEGWDPVLDRIVDDLLIDRDENRLGSFHLDNRASVDRLVDRFDG
jgi:hypothetical protein